MTLPVTSKSQREKFSGPIVVGKDILELLSSAMYVDPLSIYREYIQNAVDSIDEAAELNLYRNSFQPAIEITLNPAEPERSAKIRDNGAGLSRQAFGKILTSIGGSHKRGTKARGFRGVGRLAGLGYCQELVMRSKSKQDDQVAVMYWDCKRLKELLREQDDNSLNSIISEIVTTEYIPAKGYPTHFFEVEMRNLVRLKNDILLNESALESYLSQVGPVPFSAEFNLGPVIEKFLKEQGAGKSYKISINEKPIFRPFADKFETRKNVHSTFKDIDFIIVPGLTSGQDAVGWILHSEYFGAIPERIGIKGLRLRAGNIQIGDSRLLDSVFQETRFNSWCVGEFHIVSQKLIPNARRDDLEQNNHYSNLQNYLRPSAKKITKLCRDRSAERARSRKEAADLKSLNGHKIEWVKAKDFFAKHADKPVSHTHRVHLEKLLQDATPTYSSLMRLFADSDSEKRA
jgi:molecular chaperone HtpG